MENGAVNADAEKEATKKKVEEIRLRMLNRQSTPRGLQYSTGNLRSLSTTGLERDLGSQPTQSTRSYEILPTTKKQNGATVSLSSIKPDEIKEAKKEDKSNPTNNHAVDDILSDFTQVPEIDGLDEEKMKSEVEEELDKIMGQAADFLEEMESIINTGSRKPSSNPTSQNDVNPTSKNDINPTSKNDINPTSKNDVNPTSQNDVNPTQQDVKVSPKDGSQTDAPKPTPLSNPKPGLPSSPKPAPPSNPKPPRPGEKELKHIMSDRHLSYGRDSSANSEDGDDQNDPSWTTSRTRSGRATVHQHSSVIVAPASPSVRKVASSPKGRGHLTLSRGALLPIVENLKELVSKESKENKASKENASDQSKINLPSQPKSNPKPKTSVTPSFSTGVGNANNATVLISHKKKEYIVTFSYGNQDSNHKKNSDDDQFLVSLSCSSQLNALQIKEQLLEKAQTQASNDVKFLPVDEYVIKIPGVEYVLTNETLPLHRQLIVQVCKKSFIRPPLEMVRKPETDLENVNASVNLQGKLRSEIAMNLEINELIGQFLKKVLENDVHGEIATYRKNITRERFIINHTVAKNIEERSKTTGKYNTAYLPQYKESEPLPLSVSNKFTFLCHLPGENNMTSTIDCLSTSTVDDLQQILVKKYQRKVYGSCIVSPEGVARGGSVETTTDEYILKVTGVKEYLIGNHKLIDYDYIRKCQSKKAPMEISLVPIKDIDLEIPQQVEESLVDVILCSEKVKNRNEMVEENNREEEECLDIQQVGGYFEMKIGKIINLKNCEGVPLNEDYYKKRLELKNGKTFIFCVSGLYHGDKTLAQLMWSPIQLYNKNVDEFEFNVMVRTNIYIRDIPRAARICFSIYTRTIDMSSELSLIDKRTINEKTDVALAWVNCQYVDFKNRVRQGNWDFKLWTGKGNPIGTCVDNISDKQPPVLSVEFQKYPNTVLFPLFDPVPDEENGNNNSDAFVDRSISDRIDIIMKKDPLMELSDLEQKTLWEYREYCKKFPVLLPWFLQYTQWSDRDHVKEAYRMLKIWSPPTPFDALQLLDAKYASPVVRKYAVECLNGLDDRAVADFLLQLSQVLKYESYHDSPLAKFLLSRALLNKKQIGHAFFWHMKSDMHNPIIASRFALLTEAYLRGCGDHRGELLKQHKVLDQLTRVAWMIKKPELNAAEKKSVLLAELAKIQFPTKFQLPLDPRKEVCGLLVERCKFMDSKKLPLWLVFKNVEKIGKPVYVIFKAGDDLRQDVLTLQMLRIMDKLWKNAGVDMRLNPYGCVATGDELGMIEVVLNAATTAAINKDAGGSRAVLYSDTLAQWLKTKNPSNEGFDKAVENFMMSCAGYCVATYVLGIGDRHNDNIMLTQMGHLFHIDFGHFLGNVKSKYGIKRERAPFIFNPQFAHILGGSKDPKFADFVAMCGKAYNILRRQANMFINLFMMMLSTGIPELQCQEDIEPLKEALSLEKTDAEAAEFFTKLIHSARNTKTVLINDIIHIWAHSKKDG